MTQACCRQNPTIASSEVDIDFRRGLLALPFHPISCQLRALSLGVAGS
jgi:hypothetical protein